MRYSLSMLAIFGAMSASALADNALRSVVSPVANPPPRALAAPPSRPTGLQGAKLQTGSGLQKSTGLDSTATGGSSDDDWRALFPKKAAKR